MSYLQDVEEAKELLNDPKATYVELLDKFAELERLYGELRIKIKMGLNEDIVTLWKISAVADDIKFKLKHRVKQLAVKKN